MKLLVALFIGLFRSAHGPWGLAFSLLVVVSFAWVRGGLSSEAFAQSVSAETGSKDAASAGTSADIVDAPPAADAQGWTSLFDGKTLAGWRAAETPGSFRVEDGELVVGGGERGHLFYDGPVQDHDFKDFELRAEVKTEPNANSGIYFHTAYQASGWPGQGYECQVNNSHPDPRRTPSLYGIKDVADSPARDGEWFEYGIKVSGKQITVTINGKTVIDYTEPENPPAFDGRDRKLSHGTFALQAHDPGSVVRFRNIRVR